MCVKVVSFKKARYAEITMPIREYDCENCGRRYERLMPGFTPKPIGCECGETLEAKISAPSVIIKKPKFELPAVEVFQTEQGACTGIKFDEATFQSRRYGAVKIGAYKLGPPRNLN